MARTEGQWKKGIGLITPSEDVPVLLLNSYLNWGVTVGSSGYGFRDNGGTLEFKNNGGSWAAFGGGGAGSGDVVGPASATDNAYARYDASTGKLIQNSTKGITDAGDEFLFPTQPNPRFDITANSDVTQTYSINFLGLATAAADFRLFRSTNTTGLKRFLINKGDGTSAEQHAFNADGNSFVQNQSGNFAIGASSGAGKLFVDQNANAETIFADKDVTNGNNATNSVRIDNTSVVTDAGAYTKTGAAVQINSNVTETSGTITDSAQVLDINQTHTDATGNVVDIDNFGNGATIAGRNAGTLTWNISKTGKITLQNGVRFDNFGSTNAVLDSIGSLYLNAGFDATGNEKIFFQTQNTDRLIINETGIINALGDVTVPDEAYDAVAWNGSLEVPTKNAIRDKIESMSAGSGISEELAIAYAIAL